MPIPTGPILRAMPKRVVLFAIMASLATLTEVCAAMQPAGAPSAMSQDADETAHSASLAGVARWQDADPADLAAAATYRLPGFIDKDITLDNLRRRFGAANVRRADLDGAEGETIKGIVLFDGDPARRAELVFQDQERSRGIESMRVRGAHSRWQLDNGVHLGMTLAELVRMNGAPISFNGLDWDYGGVITDWHAGKAASQPRGMAIRSVALNHAEDAAGYPVGEGTFLSSDVRYPIQGTALFVGEIGVSFVAEAE